jgi:peptide/nickel transport system ATP-binding protein/oligopeptide transport system ATP-binding protein
MANPLLSIEDLSIGFNTENGPVIVVDKLSLQIFPGEMLGLVGESGCGKSVSAMSVVRLLPSPPGFTKGGSIKLAGEELSSLSEKEMQQIRGDRIGFIFQEPMTSLNPTLSIGFQLMEAMQLHRKCSNTEARDKAVAVLSRVGVSIPESRLLQFPHQLSGGLRQRVMIAMALMCDPVLLIADEPTTALDVTIQAQVLELLASLRDETGMAILMITHDLGVVAEYCQRVVVMYGGRVAESADTDILFEQPRHPYTQGLMDSTPSLDSSMGELPTIPGMVPQLSDRPEGCYFSNRCAHVLDDCQKVPAVTNINNHLYACWNPLT